MVRIRLARFGASKNPHYRVVVTDARQARDAKYIEAIGSYDPRRKKNQPLAIDVERARYWLSKGAQPTDTARKLLREAGVYRADRPAQA